MIRSCITGKTLDNGHSRASSINGITKSSSFKPQNWKACSLTLSGFDPQTARNLGGGNQRAAALLLSLLTLTVLIAVGSLGNLLVVAIVIGPGAAALRIARSLTGALWIAAAAAAFAGVAGIYLSYWAELAAGASIAICAVAVFALAMAMSRLTGRPAVS